MSDSIQERKFLDAVLHSITDGVFTIDEHRRITSFNHAAERITGTPIAKAIGSKCYEVFRADLCESGCILERTMITGQASIDVPVQILDSNGQRIPISISTTAYRDDQGNILGAVETFRDLSTIENLRKELAQNYSFEDIVTKSPKISKLLSILPDVAESEKTVLIQGPAGSGKELFARAIHNLSPRSPKPYLVINCDVMPPQLFESELFGGLNDANRNKPGKIALAEGGTVVFEEVGELPFPIQAQLLRLLQEREDLQVDGSRTCLTNVRIVATTKEDLREAVNQQRFRDDLYFRLAVIKFDLPPLRERREDLPLLVDHYLRLLNAKKGQNLTGVSPNVMNILLRHSFPGNINELEHIIEYGSAVCVGRTIEVDHLPVELQEGIFPKAHPLESGPFPISLGGVISEEMKIRYALQHSGGKKCVTARLLGIDRTTLWRKMKKFGIEG